LLFTPTRVKTVACRCHGRSRVLQAKCFYYFFMVVVVITDEAKATTCRALTFIVRIFVNDTIAITVWASFCFHVSSIAWLASR
jgi:hypothetical protein